MKKYFSIALGFTLFLGCTSAQLIKAVRENDTEKAKTLISTNQALINKKDKNNETPLMIAARNGNIELVKYLVEHGANVNMTKGEIIKELGYGGKIYVGLTFWFPITWIVAPFIRDYYFKGDTSTALTIAAENSHWAIMRYLLDKKATVNLPQKFNNKKIYYDKDYKDAFTIALATKNIKLLQIILPYFSCDKGYCSEENYNLMNGIYRLDPHCVDIWLKQHPQLKITLSDPMWLLNFLSNDNVSLCGYLIKKEFVPINKKNSEGQTALMVAARDGNLMAVKLFLNCGAKINLLDNNGWSAVFYSSYNHQDDITRYLLQKGANKQQLSLASKFTKDQENQRAHEEEQARLNCPPCLDECISRYKHVNSISEQEKICRGRLEMAYGNLDTYYQRKNSNNIYQFYREYLKIMEDLCPNWLRYNRPPE